MDELNVVEDISLFVLAQEPMVQRVLESPLGVLKRHESYTGGVSRQIFARGLRRPYRTRVHLR